MATLVPSFLIGSSSFLQVTRTTTKSGMSSKYILIGSCTAEFAALEYLEKSLYTYNGGNVVNTQVPSVLFVSSSFLQETRTYIKACMSLNFNQIPQLTTELPARECLKISV